MLRSRARPVLAALAVAAGLTLGAAGMLDMLERPASDAPLLARLSPDRPAVDPAGTARAAGAEPVPSPDPVPRTQRGPASGPAPAATVPTASPLSLGIGALGVDAPVVPVGVLSDGAMEIPEDVSRVGWYVRGARRISPGDAGTAVLAGHRDSRVHGLGALHGLSELQIGDTIHVTHVDGRVSVWQVDGTLLTPRDALPSDVLFARDGPPRLAVVTCGGDFDRSLGSYTHNVIVLASQVPD